MNSKDELRKPVMEFHNRLDRIETKLDRLSDVVVGHARLEERMITLFSRMDLYDTKQEKVILRISEVERVTIGRGIFFRWIDRAALAAVGAAIVLLLDEINQLWG